MMYMMPLSFAPVGQPLEIKKVSGNQEMKKHLEGVIPVPGINSAVVQEIAGNMILNVKESRVAINRDLASKIMI